MISHLGAEYNHGCRIYAKIGEEQGKTELQKVVCSPYTDMGEDGGRQFFTK
jgi:hypothetical protein